MSACSFPLIISRKKRQRLLFNDTWKPRSKFWNKAEEEDFYRHDTDIGNDAADDVFHAALGTDAFEDKKVHAYGRRDKGHFHVDLHHDIEPNGIKTQLFDDGV